MGTGTKTLPAMNANRPAAGGYPGRADGRSEKIAVTPSAATGGGGAVPG